MAAWNNRNPIRRGPLGDVLARVPGRLPWEFQTSRVANPRDAAPLNYVFVIL